MSVSLNTNILQSTMASGVLVLLGVVSKNSSTQLKHKAEYTMLGTKWSVYEILGMILFTLGWLGVALNTSGNKMNMAMMSSLGVWASVMAMMYLKKLYGKKLPQWFYILPVVFALSWLALGYSVGMGKSNLGMYLGLSSAVMVLLSMLYLLPWQRKNCVVDGLGMALFAFAWVALSMANAM